ncbi:amidohydrolase family protein [Thiobacillus sp.]|uniref:amidohydrolase family protein n=1 Tax=Thiobacillus sp. TaxID=924 RepID=UPI00286DCC94|nr:amidohydrolase family protein [Thiobacillus sp.]
MKRRSFLLGLGAVGAAAWAGSRWWPDGEWRNPCLPGLPQALAEHPLVRAAWDGLDPTQVWDMHVHVAGTGTGDSGSGMRVNPTMDSLAHPILYTQKRVFMDAACASGDSGVDAAYLDRLLHLATAFPPGVKFMLYAMEQFHDDGGHAHDVHTGIHVPNAYVRTLAQTYPQRFEWVASIHPYRADAIARLEQAIRDGARAVKWLPSAMGIHPASAQCDAFYAALKRHDLPLIVHTGTELSVNSEGHSQDHNNPLHLRRPLAAGVRVVAAHCASLGQDRDWDAGDQAGKVSSFTLFTRLMNEPVGVKLYGDLSAIPQFHRYRILPTLLENAGWQARLLNASDYPLPGILPIYLLKELVRAGLLKADEAEVLHAIRRHNPLLFDFVMKRSLTWNGKQFDARCFETRAFFDRTTGVST